MFYFFIYLGFVLASKIKTAAHNTNIISSNNSWNQSYNNRTEKKPWWANHGSRCVSFHCREQFWDGLWWKRMMKNSWVNFLPMQGKLFLHYSGNTWHNVNSMLFLSISSLTNAHVNPIKEVNTDFLNIYFKTKMEDRISNSFYYHSDYHYES